MKIILSLLCFEIDSHVAQVGLELAVYVMTTLIACASSPTLSLFKNYLMCTHSLPVHIQVYHTHIWFLRSQNRVLVL